MKSFYFSILSFFFIVACQNNPSPAIERTPTSVIQSEEQTVGIYSFEHFEKFLEAKNDTTYIINFWATWCRPCVAELPYFEQLYQQYKKEKVHFVFVSLDFEKELEKKLLPFLQKNQLNGEVLVLSQKGMNDWIGKIDASWSGTLPTTIIYNQTGRDFYPHSFEYKELEKALQKRHTIH